MKRLALAFVLFLLSTGYAVAAEPGLYYDPSQDGHGVALHANDQGGLVVLWFTYSPDGEQAWFLSSVGAPGMELDLFFPSGLFPARLHDVGDPVGGVRFRTTASGGLRLNYWIDLWDADCTMQPLPSPVPPTCAGTVVFNRLAD